MLDKLLDLGKTEVQNVLAGVVGGVQAAALREAADAFTYEPVDEFPQLDSTQRRNAERRVETYLRERADRLESKQQQ